MNAQHLFYGYLRSRNCDLFGTSLTQRQVDGIDPLLRAGRDLGLPHMANVLAQVWHETGAGMFPVKETVFAYSKDKNPTDAQVIARLDKAFAAGKLPWVKAPYWRDGWFGRGQIQITHKANYEKLAAVLSVDLVGNPGLALDPGVSARIAVEGMRLGIFTGKKLSSFTTPTGYDHRAARAIVNGDVRTVGPKIAAAAVQFEAALAAGSWVPASETPKISPVAAKPAPTHVALPEKPLAPVGGQPEAPKPYSFWAELFKALAGIWKGH